MQQKRKSCKLNAVHYHGTMGVSECAKGKFRKSHVEYSKKPGYPPKRMGGVLKDSDQ